MMSCGMLHDANSVILLLREHLGTSRIGGEGARIEMVWGNRRRRGIHEGLGNARHGGVWTDCMGTGTLWRYVPRCSLGHLVRHTAGKGSREGEGLVLSRNIRCRALGENRWGQGEWRMGTPEGA